MRRKMLPVLVVFMMVTTGCAWVQCIVKSTFPYTTTLTIPASSQAGNEYTAISMATSYDQNFFKNGDDGDKVSVVRVVSAKLRSIVPTDFNIGNLVSAKFYMSKTDGKDEVLVASRTDITEGVGNSIVLDIDNTNFLDQFIPLPDVRIRMVYKLRNNISTDASLRLVLGLSAYPNRDN